MKELNRDELKAKADELGIDYGKTEKSDSILKKVNALTGEDYTFKAAVKKVAVVEDGDVIAAKAALAEAVAAAAALGIEVNAPAKVLDQEDEDVFGMNERGLEMPDTPIPDDCIRCIVHSNDRENEETEMSGNLNCIEPFQVQLGEVVDLPKRYIPVVRGAVEKRHIPVMGEDGLPTGKINIRKHPRYIIESV